MMSFSQHKVYWTHLLFGGWALLYFQGFTYPVRAHFLENILEMTRYQLNEYNQIDDYGQEKAWKMQKQAPGFKKRKSQIASTVEVYKICLSFCCNPSIIF